MKFLIFTYLVQTLSVLQGQSNKTVNTKTIVENLPEVNGDKFFYFGYGSNMLAKRIHIQNPTAVKIGPALLENYRLDFYSVSTRWRGSVATVVKDLNRSVQGTLWEIALSNLDDIDNQEGVQQGIYKPLSVSVTQLNNNKTVLARVYLLVNQPPTDIEELERELIPFDRQPSKTYLQCLVKGAIETGIDQTYIEWLKSVKHNDNIVDNLENLLELKDVLLNS